MSGPALPAADLGDSFNSFFDAAGEFFRNLADISWPAMVGACLCLTGMQLARAWAWRNVLQAAYPERRIGFTRFAAAYLTGAGINAILPARAGDVTKVFLVKQQIEGSSYPAVTSSFLVQTVFDTTAGILVFIYALTQGLLPRPPELPRLPAFEIAFWADHPDLLLLAITLAGVGFVVAFAILARRVEMFWQRVKQGLVILTTPRRYLLKVASWQAVGWLFRFGSFWLFLEAFGIGGSFGNVMLVMSVQAIAGIVPLTPGGAGAQQALLVATLEGPSRAAVLSYSVGTQIATAAWAVIMGFLSILLVFRTSDWRALIRSAEEDAARDREAREQGQLDQPS